MGDRVSIRLGVLSWKGSFQAAVADANAASGGVSAMDSGVEIDGGGVGREAASVVMAGAIAVGGGMAVRGSAVSVVRRPRSLMVSLCGFVTWSKSGISSWV